MQHKTRLHWSTQSNGWAPVRHCIVTQSVSKIPVPQLFKHANITQCGMDACAGDTNAIGKQLATATVMLTSADITHCIHMCVALHKRSTRHWRLGFKMCYKKCSHSMPNMNTLLDLSNCLARIQTLGADLCAVHNLVTSVQLVGIIYLS